MLKHASAYFVNLYFLVLSCAHNAFNSFCQEDSVETEYMLNFAGGTIN